LGEEIFLFSSAVVSFGFIALSSSFGNDSSFVKTRFSSFFPGSSGFIFCSGVIWGSTLGSDRFSGTIGASIFFCSLTISSFCSSFIWPIGPSEPSTFWSDSSAGAFSNGKGSSALTTLSLAKNRLSSSFFVSTSLVFMSGFISSANFASVFSSWEKLAFCG